MRSVYNLLGGLCVVLGVIGILLPLMPTTVFLLLASFFFSKGSPRCRSWLLNHRYFGHYIRDYHAGRGIPKKCKIIAISMIWCSIGGSIVFMITIFWLQALLFSIAVALSAYLIWLPTTRITTCPIKAVKTPVLEPSE